MTMLSVLFFYILEYNALPPITRFECRLAIRVKCRRYQFLENTYDGFPMRKSVSKKKYGLSMRRRRIRYDRERHMTCNVFPTIKHNNNSLFSY